MGLSSSKPFQISLSDIIEEVRCYSASCGGQVIVEDHCEFEESTDKGSQEFNTKSPVAFTCPLALYRDAKKRYPSPTFRQVSTWLQSKDTYTLHKPVQYNFPRNRIIVTGTDDQWQEDLVDMSSLARFNKGYKF